MHIVKSVLWDAYCEMHTVKCILWYVYCDVYCEHRVHNAWYRIRIHITQYRIQDSNGNFFKSTPMCSSIPQLCWCLFYTATILWYFLLTCSNPQSCMPVSPPLRWWKAGTVWPTACFPPWSSRRGPQRRLAWRLGTRCLGWWSCSCSGIASAATWEPDILVNNQINWSKIPLSGGEWDLPVQNRPYQNMSTRRGSPVGNIPSLCKLNPIAKSTKMPIPNLTPELLLFLTDLL